MPRTDRASSPGEPPGPLVPGSSVPARLVPGPPVPDLRRRIWPLTGRTGGAAPGGRPAIDAEPQPAASTTHGARIRVPSPSSAPATRLPLAVLLLAVLLPAVLLLAVLPLASPPRTVPSLAAPWPP